MAATLRVNSTLSLLALGGIEVGISFSNHHCINAFIKGNRIGDEGAHAIATVLQTNTAMITLDLSGTLMC